MSLSANVSGLLPTNTRALRDGAYIANVALPVGGASTNTAALDLGLSRQLPNGGFDYATTPYAVSERFVVNIATTAVTGSANSKNVNIVLQSTGSLATGAVDTANFANVAVFANPLLSITDNSGSIPTASVKVSLAPDFGKRFIRAQAVAEANAGTIVGTMTLQLLF